MTIFKTADLSAHERKKVGIAKADMEARNNKDFLLKLVDEHNELRMIRGRVIL